MAEIYLDHAATTPTHPEVRAAMEPWLWDHFGNPSSRHVLGMRAKVSREPPPGSCCLCPCSCCLCPCSLAL